MSAAIISTRLDRPDSGISWGFRLAGGKDFGAPLTIQRVIPGGLAAESGLEVGDEIKMIGTTSTEGLRHSEAQQLIREAGNSVELKLERGGSTVKLPESTISHSSAQLDKPDSLVQTQTYKPKTSAERATLEAGDVSSKVETTYNNSVTTASSHSKVTSADEIFPSPPELPPPPPSSGAPSSQSARYSDQQQESDVPQFQGFVDPHLQSRSFKLLQNAIDSGEDISKLTIRASSPIRSASPGQKPAIGVKPAIPKQGPTTSTAVKPAKPAIIKQYNSPAGLYSEDKTAEALEKLNEIHTGDDVVLDVHVERKTIVVPSKKVVSSHEPPQETIIDAPMERKKIVISSDKLSKDTIQEPVLQETIDVQVERKKIVIPSDKFSKSMNKETVPAVDRIDGNANAPDFENSNGQKRYYPSETMKLIQDQESGRPQIQINPKTGAQLKTNQSKKLIQLEKNFDGGFASGPPPPPTSYKVSAEVSSDSGARQLQESSGIRQVKAGEAKKLPAILEALKVPVCTECGSSIRGPYISALGKAWCPEHFICAYPSCHTSLIDCGFVEEDGRLYCEHDYQQHFAPKCGKCGQGIVGEVVSALQQKFHSSCFVCFKCHLPITGGLFHTENGEPYCEKDWSIIFQTKCYGCQFPIDDGDLWVDALSYQWHSECLKCVICQINLDGQSFYAKNGKPYCKKHGSV